ncbi:MAG: hypothetical protein ACHQO8_02145 [Vicinamibacterales bacterium]
MADLNVRSDSVDVEQIMRQIRTRIREKRGVDYTEAELQQLANVKLEQFLDPRGVRSDLVEQFRKHRIVSPAPPNYEFEDTTLYETHRGVLRFIRKLLNPVLKLFFNPNRIVNALHIQADVNAEFHRRFRQREEMDPLFYEVIHNLVVEATRLGVEVHNLKMRVESLSSRLDFDERRGRSLESVVQYKRTGATGSAGSAGSAGSTGSAGESRSASEPRSSGEMRSPGDTRSPGDASPKPWAESGARPDGGGREGGGREGGRRRRRRRRRRPGQTMGDQQRGPGSTGDVRSPGDSGSRAEAGDASRTPPPEADDSSGPDDGAEDQ